MRYRMIRYGAVEATARVRRTIEIVPVRITLGEARWQPEADVYETAAAVTVVVELAGVDDDAVEVVLFDDELVVEGERRLACEEDAVYHRAGIRQGPFRLVVPIPPVVDRAAIHARYDRGLLVITLPRVREA